jgi:ribosomal-protein-alanine N-acetyltransferase
VRLRFYEPADFAGLHEMDQSCFPPGIAYSKRMLRYFLASPSATCIVALQPAAANEGEKITGFILFESDGTTAHIVTLDVSIACRRRGVGSLLLDAMETALTREGAKAIILETAVNNHAAIALWKRHGFHSEGTLKRYYLNRVDALQMRKLLPSLAD